MISSDLRLKRIKKVFEFLASLKRPALNDDIENECEIEGLEIIRFEEKFLLDDIDSLSISIENVIYSTPHVRISNHKIVSTLHFYFFPNSVSLSQIRTKHGPTYDIHKYKKNKLKEKLRKINI